jgi:FixJ family two-component response regulator
VLLTDIGLPDVAGDHLIREILGMKTFRPRVVVMTGFGEPHIGLVRRAGADAVFTKPLEWSDLRDQLALDHATALAA